MNQIKKFTLTRAQLVDLVGEDAIMASTAIQSLGYWRLRGDDLWEFVPDDSL